MLRVSLCSAKSESTISSHHGIDRYPPCTNSFFPPLRGQVSRAAQPTASSISPVRSTGPLDDDAGEVGEHVEDGSGRVDGGGGEVV